MTKFDLHLHSNFSDGSASVKELVATVIDSGIEIFALTDHDTVAGVNEAEKYVNNLTSNHLNLFGKRIRFIKGVELTCKIDDINCHILGYNINPDSKELSILINTGKKLRKQKLETRIKYLKDIWNIELTKEEIDWLYSRQSVVKTHLANILVKRGLSDNNVSAMKKYLDDCKTGNTRFDGKNAIRVIKQAGGTPIWAHPLGGEGEVHLSEKEFLPKLKKMIDCGIQGLECYYSRYSINEAEFLVQSALENNLIITGGSDWHGTNKTVPIGQLNIENTDIDSEKITLFS